MNRLPDSVAPDGAALYFVPVVTARFFNSLIDYCEPIAAPHCGDGPASTQNPLPRAGRVGAADRPSPTSGLVSSRGADPLNNASSNFTDSPDSLAPHGGSDSAGGQ